MNESEEFDWNERRPSRRKRILVWAIVVILTLPVLFWLFEFVVPTFLPENF